VYTPPPTDNSQVYIYIWVFPTPAHHILRLFTRSDLALVPRPRQPISATCARSLLRSLSRGAFWRHLSRSELHCVRPRPPQHPAAACLDLLCGPSRISHSRARDNHEGFTVLGDVGHLAPLRGPTTDAPGLYTIPQHILEWTRVRRSRDKKTLFRPYLSACLPPEPWMQQSTTPATTTSRQTPPHPWVTAFQWPKKQSLSRSPPSPRTLSRAGTLPLASCAVSTRRESDTASNPSHRA
jgi:hypothetical protein